MEERRKMDYINLWDPKWAHPELVEEGYWTMPVQLDPRLSHTITPESAEEGRKWMIDFMNKMKADNPAADNSKYVESTHYTEHGCPEEPDAPNQRIIVSKPRNMKPGKKYPAIFCISGGGMCNGGIAEIGLGCIPLYIEAMHTEVVTVCFDYRIAPATQYPGAVNDCHAAYLWMLENAEMLSIDTDNIVLFGGSVGGPLAICTAFRLKRYNWCGGSMPRGLVLYVPVMDDVSPNTSFKYTFINPTTELVEGWESISCYNNFKLYLGDRFGDPTLSPEAMPNRMTREDVKGLPPVWIPAETELECSRDSLYKFVQYLHEEQIFCDLHVWGGCGHGGTGNGGSYLSQRVRTVVTGSLDDAVTYDFRRPWLNE